MRLRPLKDDLTSVRFLPRLAGGASGFPAHTGAIARWQCLTRQSGRPSGVAKDQCGAHSVLYFSSSITERSQREGCCSGMLGTRVNPSPGFASVCCAEFDSHYGPDKSLMMYNPPMRGVYE